MNYEKGRKKITYRRTYYDGGICHLDYAYTDRGCTACGAERNEHRIFSNESCISQVDRSAYVDL